MDRHCACVRYASVFFFSSRRRHTRWTGDWSSDVCSSDLIRQASAFQLAVLHYNKHDYQGSSRYFGEAVRLDPTDMDAKRNLASSLRQAGMPDRKSVV